VDAWFKINSFTGAQIGGSTGQSQQQYLACQYVGPTLYVIGSSQILYTIDPTLPGAENFVANITLGGGSIPGDPRSLAYDTKTGIVYLGYIGNTNLYTLNVITGVATLVGDTTHDLESLSIGPDGELYAGNNLTFYHINKSNGSSTIINQSIPVSNSLTLVPFWQKCITAGDQVFCGHGDPNISANSPASSKIGSVYINEITGGIYKKVRNTGLMYATSLNSVIVPPNNSIYYSVDYTNGSYTPIISDLFNFPSDIEYEPGTNQCWYQETTTNQ
jgi:hypothetical protein